MQIRLSQALAHLQQLIELGCDYEQAVRDTTVAFDLDTEAADLLAECYDYELMVGHYG